MLQLKIPCAELKTWRSQINKYFLKREREMSREGLGPHLEPAGFLLGHSEHPAQPSRWVRRPAPAPVPSSGRSLHSAQGLNLSLTPHALQTEGFSGEPEEKQTDITRSYQGWY